MHAWFFSSNDNSACITQRVSRFKRDVEAEKGLQGATPVLIGGVPAREGSGKSDKD
jgi:hypothetical protein